MLAPSLLDPKNDFVFKRLFTQRPELLADLINAVRSDQPSVEVIEVLNPRIDPAELTGKFIVLDVLARDVNGSLYGIEMQVRRQPAWDARSAFYLARTFANQLRSGEDYEDLRPAIAIHLMDFELFDDPAQAHWRFELRDRDQPAVRLTSALQWNLIELPKLDRRHTDIGTLAAWVAYFEHWREDPIMSAITHTPIKQALQQLEELSADEEAQRLAFVRERAQRDEASFLKAARREGQEEGENKARLEIARSLIEQPGIDDATIAQLTKLTAEEIRQLRQSAGA
ncbi:MAG: Rpn family recombination-promoting nuclease/putative transposase [Burkholderiales bacterium]|nr:Rpn family recombination-promoting nuclease/putative transposase [Burkholderiales bacterium]